MEAAEEPYAFKFEKHRQPRGFLCSGSSLNAAFTPTSLTILADAVFVSSGPTARAQFTRGG
jgi:hypothetical protein